MWSWDFWKKTIERAIKTPLEVYVIAIGADGANWFSVNYNDMWKLAVGSMIACVAVSLISSQVGPTKDDPSVV